MIEQVASDLFRPKNFSDFFKTPACSRFVSMKRAHRE